MCIWAIELFRKLTISSKHPLDDKFYSLIAKKKKSGPPLEQEARTWIELTNKDGAPFFYNFADGTSTEKSPAPSVVLEPLAITEVYINYSKELNCNVM